MDMASYDSELEFQKMVQEKLMADQRKQAERTARYRNTQYGKQTTCMVNNQKQAPPPPPMKKTVSMDEYEIQQLKIENQKLLKENKEIVIKYNDLLEKANKIVEAYKKLQTENEKLKAKKATQEVASKALADVGKGVRTTWDKIILWFKT